MPWIGSYVGISSLFLRLFLFWIVGRLVLGVGVLEKYALVPEK